ncbi:exonuclease SbcCD subunit D [bacterium]|nr:MAG: exonuclease SbcCD subunit D [bacterium]QQR61495.1 MAG: exonuclease SbcCD subunit D [bacterium]QQR62977.1 MAG: exonuclease SbcCD subunit D [bacterium]
MIRFVHTADIHFGMENYGKIDPATGIHSRLLDFAHALHFCIDHAIEQKVDFFLFCGDAYKTHNPSQTQQKLLFDCLLRLYANNIPVVIIVGNHDHPLSFGKAHALNLFSQLPLDGFHVIEKPTSLLLNTKHGPIQIVGIPWPTRNTVALHHKHNLKMATDITQYISEAVSIIIQKMASELNQAIPAVLAAHLTVSSGIFSGSEKKAIYGTDPIFMPSQLALKPFDYVALGHLHRHQNLNENGAVPIIYPGSIERIDFGERKEEKGFCIVSIDRNKHSSFEFVKVPTRPFIYIETKLDPLSCQTEQIINNIRQHAIENAVIRIAYHVPTGKQDVVDLQKIEAALSAACYIAGITPIAQPHIRTQRTISGQNNTMDFETLLKTYFETKPSLKERQNELVEKTLQLLHEAQDYSDHED